MTFTDLTNDYHMLQFKLTGIEQIMQQIVFLDRCKNSEELNVAIQALLHVLGDYTQSERVFIFDFNEDRSFLSNTFEWCAKGVTPFIDLLQSVSPLDIPYWIATFSRGKCIIIKDIEEVRQLMPAEYHMLQIQNIHSEISFPLIYRDTFCGFIGLDNPTMERTEPIVHILEVVGRTLCAARENIRKDRLLEENQNSMQTSLKELEKERAVLSVLCEDYTSVYEVDLLSQKMRILKIDSSANIAQELMPHRNETLHYMPLLEQYCTNFVIPDLAPDFLKKLQPEYLMEQLTKKGRYVYHYRAVPNAMGRQYFELLASLLWQTEDSFHVIMGFRHIDETVKEAQKQQRKLEEALDAANLNNEIISAISKIYFSIYRIDLANDIYEEVSSGNELHRLTGHTGKASTKMIELCQNFVTQEYQPQVLKFFDLSTLPIRLLQEETLAIEYLAKDGNWHLARFIVKRRNNEGEVTNILYVTRLISDQKRRERNWISAAKEAERANQAKSDFLSRMAHDIRTPLNAIMGFRDIASSSVNDQQKVSDSLEHIRIAGSYLQQLVNDILDIAAIENYHLQLHPAPMQLSSVYDLLAGIYTPMAEKKQIQLEFQLHDLDTNNLMADELRLRQIYANLLSNAIKYTPDGGHVTFELFEQPGDTPATVQLSAIIRDTGIGIHPDYLEKIYDKFSREVDTRVNSVRGSGLGLAIVRELVDLMDGSIDVQSEVGKGTTFIIRLPLAYTVEKATAVSTASQITLDSLNTDSCRGLHLLVAEDNDLNYDVISELLALHGLTCDRAENGKICVERFSSAPSNTYDAILMDMQMPVMDGPEAAKKIRALKLPQAATIPILAITANAFAQDIARCKAAGMNDHLPKPINIHKLLAMLALYVQPHS